jgi:hypothetical protein
MHRKKEEVGLESSDIGLESSAVVSETESEALALASAASSFGVACKTSYAA